MRSRPGNRVRALALRLCRAETVERVVDPLIADLQFEHAHAMRGGRTWRARRLPAVTYVGYGAVLMTGPAAGRRSLS